MVGLVAFLVAWALTYILTIKSAVGVPDTTSSPPNKFTMFLLSNLTTIKLVLTWVSVLLLTITLWHISKVLILESVISQEFIAKAQSIVLDSTTKLAYDPRTYTLTLAAMAISFALNLLLAIFVYAPPANQQDDEDRRQTHSAEVAEPARKAAFVVLTLHAAAIIFLSCNILL
jgi:hypothetical protein